jgi:hypothetical protein
MIQRSSVSSTTATVTGQTNMTIKLEGNVVTLRSAEHRAPRPQTACAGLLESGEAPKDASDGLRGLQSTASATRRILDAGAKTSDDLDNSNASGKLGNTYAVSMLRDATVRSASLRRGNSAALHSNVSLTKLLTSSANLSGSLSSRYVHLSRTHQHCQVVLM